MPDMMLSRINDLKDDSTSQWLDHSSHMLLSLLVVLCASLSKSAWATENAQGKENGSDSHLVYGIDLSKYQRDTNAGKPLSNVDNGYSSGGGLSKYVRRFVESMERDASTVILLSVALFLVLTNYIAMSRTYQKRAVFFANGGDVFWFCLPLIVMFLAHILPWTESEPSGGEKAGHVRVGNMLMYVSFIFLVLYNLIRPLIENRHGSLLLAICVAVSRLTLGYLLVFGILLAFGVMSSTTKQDDESRLAFEARRRNDMLMGAAMLGAFGALLRSLIGRPYEEEILTELDGYV